MQNTVKVPSMIMLLKGKYPVSVLGCQSQTRHYRKPRWIPMAKTKMYKIIEPPVQYPHETEEVRTLMNSHRIYNRSLWLFQREISQEQFAKSQLDASEISEDVDVEKILLETERDNAKVRAHRDKCLAEEWKQIEEKIILQRLANEELELQKIQHTEQHIQAELERLKIIIREEDLDEAIEKALATVVDYNFALDKDGKVYKGRFNNDKVDSSSAISKPMNVPIS